MSDPPIKLMIAIVDLAAGTGTVVRNLGAGLKKLFPGEFEVVLLTFRDEKPTDDDRRCFDQTHSLHLKVHPGVRQVLELPAAISRMRKAVRQIRPDVILSVHTFANWLSSYCAGQTPVILTDHLNLTQRQAARGKNPFRLSIMRKMYRKHLAVGVSQQITDDLKNNFSAPRAVTIYNGVDVERIRARAMEKSAVEWHQPYVVAVGRLFKQKDYPTLIQAYQIARQNGFQPELVIVGDGPERSDLEALIRSMNMSTWVHLAGHQDNPFPLIRNARMLALSSVYEGFGLVLSEALALGIPIVSTDCPSGPAEILGGGEFGLLVPVQNPQKLADAMLRLDSDQTLRQQFSAKSEPRVRQFDIDQMARKYREVILAELKSHRQP